MVSFANTDCSVLAFILIGLGSYAILLCKPQQVNQEIAQLNLSFFLEKIG